MTRLALFLMVGFLATSTAGILDLVLPEPCAPSESASAPADGSCPATCVKCHCAGAFDSAVQLEVRSPLVSEPDWVPPAPIVPKPFSHDILHVPKPTLG